MIACPSGSDDPVISETPSKRLLAVVLARHQAKHGFDNQMNETLAYLIQETDV